MPRLAALTIDRSRWLSSALALMHRHENPARPSQGWAGQLTGEQSEVCSWTANGRSEEAVGNRGRRLGVGVRDTAIVGDPQ